MLQYQLFRPFQAYGLRVIFYVIINGTGNVLTNISQCKFMKLSSITLMRTHIGINIKRTKQELVS